MREPIVFVVDEDPRALAALTAALQRRFGADYQIVADGDPDSATAKLAEACDGGAQVALVIATSLEWLAEVHDICPHAARGILVRYGDGASYPAVRRAIVLGQVDTFLLKPIVDPEDRLYPVVSAAAPPGRSTPRSVTCNRARFRARAEFRGAAAPARPWSCAGPRG